jgi:hypothetical protein
MSTNFNNPTRTYRQPATGVDNTRYPEVLFGANKTPHETLQNIPILYPVLPLLQEPQPVRPPAREPEAENTVIERLGTSYAVNAKSGRTRDSPIFNTSDSEPPAPRLLPRTESRREAIGHVPQPPRCYYLPPSPEKNGSEPRPTPKHNTGWWKYISDLESHVSHPGPTVFDPLEEPRAIFSDGYNFKKPTVDCDIDLDPEELADDTSDGEDVKVSAVTEDTILPHPKFQPERFILLCISSHERETFKQYHMSVHHPTEDKTWDDEKLFLSLRKAYNEKLRTFWQRYLSLKGLKHIVLLQHTAETRPCPAELHPFARQELLYAFNHPKNITTESEWIDWIFKLKSAEPTKFALEFVLDWKTSKILIVGTTPWVASCVTTVLWSILGKNITTALAVASFMLTISGGVLALLAILSTFDR